MATYINGQSEILSVWDDTNSYDPIVCLISHTLSENVDEIAAPLTKCDSGNALVKSPGDYSYEISFEGLYAETEADKFSWAELRTKLRALGTFTWKIDTTYSSGSDAEYGTAFFSNLEKTSENKEKITFSGTLVGSGSIVSVDPNAT